MIPGLIRVFAERELFLVKILTFLAVFLLSAALLTAEETEESASASLFFTPQAPVDLEEEYPSYSEILFTHENSPHGFITYRELTVWAQSRNLGVLPDCPFRDLSNHIAAVIPRTGMKFHLRVPENKRMYLHIDLVNFRPLSVFRKDSVPEYCTPSDGAVFRTKDKSFDLPQVQYLEVRFGGKNVKRIHMGGGVFPVTPAVIPVDREHYRDHVLKVELRPSGAASFFAVWDVFLSGSPL